MLQRSGWRVAFLTIYLAAPAIAQTAPTSAPSLQSPDLKVRALAVWKLSETRGSRALPALAPALNDPEPSIRALAATLATTLEISEAAGYAVVEKLSDLSRNDPSVNVRAASAEAVRQIGFLSAYPVLSIVKPKLAQGNEDQKLAALLFLSGSTLQADEVKTILFPALNDASANVRRAAADAIARRNQELGLSLVSSVHPEVRDAAARQLFWVFRDAGKGTALEKQLAALRADNDPEIRILGELLSEWVNTSNRVPLPLAQLTLAIRYKNSSSVRLLAGRSMMFGDFGGPRQLHGTAALVSAMDDPDPAVATDAIRTLSEGHNIGQERNFAVAKAGNGKLIEALAAKLNDRSDGTRIAALDQLATLPPEQAFALWKFAMALLDDPAPKVSDAALRDCRLILNAYLRDYIANTATTPAPAPTTTMTTLPASVLSSAPAK